MSRIIRRVPLNWKHPKDENDHYLPMFDEDYETALKRWNDNSMAWENGTHKDLINKPKHKEKYPTFQDWDGGPPDPEVYRPKFADEPTHYQIYEDVTEGTPFSPIFETLEEMKDWLLAEGYSEFASQTFIENGWAPSMVFTTGKGVSGIGIHSLNHFEEESK